MSRRNAPFGLQPTACGFAYFAPVLRYACFFILLAGLHAVACGQPLRLPAHIFTADDGLGGASITSLVKDSRGFLWIGTPDELLLYDGLRFMPFRYRDSGRAAAPFRRAVVLQAGKDTFLILHEGGGHQYTQRSGLLRRISLPFQYSGLLPDAGLSADTAAGWYRLTTGNMKARYQPRTGRWDAVVQQPLRRLANDISTRGTANVYFDTSERGKVLQLYEPVSGTSLFSHRFPFTVQSAVRMPEGLLLLDAGKRQHLWWMPDGATPRMLLSLKQPARELRAVAAGDKVYVSAEANLYRFEPATGNVEELLAEDGSPLISKGFVTRFLPDGRTLWVGTNASGLLRLSPEGARFRHIRSPMPAQNFVNAIFPDLAAGRIYTGAFSGAFVAYDTSGAFRQDLSRRLRADSVFWSFGFNHIERRPDGALFIVGGHNLACLFYPKTGAVVQLTSSMKRLLINVGQPAALQPGRKTVRRAGHDEWWMTAKNGLALWKLAGSGAQSHMELLRFISLPLSPEGVCNYNGSWYCATAGKLYRIDNKGIADSALLPLGSLVTCMQPDKQGRLWIATESGLMLWRNGRTERILTTENGLPDNHVYALLPDSAGWMWGSTNRGLFAVRTDDFRVRSFTSGDGLQGAEFNSGAAAVDAQGRFYFGGMNGVNMFHPAAALCEDAASQVTITRIAAPDTVYYTYPGAAQLPGLKLPYDRANVQLAYTAAQPSASGARQYEYRLRDGDTIWTDNGRDGELQLYLAPGSYHIQVRLRGVPGSAAGVWVDVAPPFYRTAWFVLLMIALGAAVVAAIIAAAARVRYRQKLAVLETAKHIQEEKERISRELHDELGARAALIAHNAGLLGDAAKSNADTTLLADRIAGTTADMLTALRETVWTLKQETVTAESLWLRYKNFIAKLSATYSGIRFVVEEDPLPATPLDYARALNLLRILQEATMNAVKHSAAEIVTASARVNPEGLQFTVADNGQGFDAAATQASGDGNGLHNMAQRSREANLRLSIRWGDAGGTVVEIIA